MTGVLRHGARAGAAASALGSLAALGMPAVAAAAGLAVLLLAAACWVLGSWERSERVARIMLARRGDPRCLYSAEGPGQGVPAGPGLGPSQPIGGTRSS